MARRASTEDKPNVNPNDEAECAALYEDHMASMARIKQRIATDFGRYEKMGVSSDAIRYNYRMSHQSDPGATHRQRTLTMARLGTIEYGADGQGDFSAALHATKPSPDALAKLAVARAFGDGYNTGLAGGQIDACKHTIGSEEFVRWRDGWTDGYADRIARKPELENVTQAEPRRRGRPPGSKNKKPDEPIEQTDLEEHIVNAAQEAASLH